MRKMIIYDPAMCCSTGICGVGVDKELLRISAAINKLKDSGVIVERYNPNTEPQKFVANEIVNQIINEKGIKALPLTLIDDKIIKIGSYPSNIEIIQALNLSSDFFNITIKKCNPKGNCC